MSSQQSATHWLGKEREYLHQRRLSACPTWKLLVVEERAAASHGGKSPGLTGQEVWIVVTACARLPERQQVPNCTLVEQGVVCNKKHNQLLHGASSKYFANGKVLWDNAANICLIRRSYAQLLQSEGQPCVQHVQGAGKPSESWRTKAHKVTMTNNERTMHNLVAFEVQQITRLMGSVDASVIVKNFPRISEKKVLRQCGEVDLLVGIQHAGLNPTEYLNLADKLLWLAAAFNIHKLMVAGKLVGLALRWANG